MIDNLYQFREDLKGKGVYLSFTGPFSQSFIECIAEIVRQKMQLEDVKKSIVMNVFAVVVEQMQNILHYSAEKILVSNLAERHSEYPLGTLVVGHDDEHYFVLSGNMIANTNVENLREKLTTLRNMTKDELKKYHKKQFRQQPEQGSKGAGLGFIEMAKKASQPLEFDFQKIDEDVSFFSIKVII